MSSWVKNSVWHAISELCWLKIHLMKFYLFLTKDNKNILFLKSMVLKNILLLIYHFLLIVEIISIFFMAKKTLYRNKLSMLLQSVSERNKCMCGSSYMLCCGCVRSCAVHNSFASYDQSSFLLVVLKGLIVTVPKHWVTWSYRTGFNFPFLRGKTIE